MKKLLVLLVLLWATVLHAQITYWWSQMLKKPDAKQSQEFFFVPGTNIYFTYATNRVIINGSGTNVVIATSTNSLYSLYATNWIGSTNALTNLDYTYITNAPWQWACGNLSNWCLIPTNALSSSGGTNFDYTAITNPPWQWGCDNLTNWCNISTNVLTNLFVSNSLYSLWSTNWANSNSMWLSVSNAIWSATNGFTGGGQTNIWATNLMGIVSGTNILFTTNNHDLVINWNPAVVSSGSNITANLIAWWKMDDGTGTNALDSSGNGNTATLTNSPNWLLGHIGPYCLQFNSNSTQGGFAMALTNLSSVTYGTVTWWQYHTNAFNDGTQRGMWGQERYVGFYKSFDCQVYTDNYWHIGWYDTTLSPVDMRLTIAANAANWPQNQWIHYAYAWTPTGSKFYTNGILAQATNVTTTAVDMAGNFPFAFGMLPVVPRVCFNGLMDDFRIYGTNLSDAQVLTVYNYNSVTNFIGQTNWSYTAITNAPWQWGCDNLTNWCNVSTNTLTNILLLDSNYTWTSTTALTNAVNTVSNFTLAVSNHCETATGGLTNLINTVSNLDWHTTGNYLGADGTLGTLNNFNLLLKANNIGAGGIFTDGSVVLGQTATHSGPGNVVALGHSAEGQQGGSVAIGQQALSTAGGGIAIGIAAHAHGAFSVAMTANSSADGSSSVAIGDTAHTVSDYATAIGYTATANGLASVAMGVNATAVNDGSFVYNDSNFSGYSDTAPNQFVVYAAGGIDLHSAGAGLVTDAFATSGGTVTGTNFVTSTIKWVDININYALSASGPTAPSLVSVTNPAAGSLIQQLAFDNNDELFGQCQLPHTVAVTNASFPAFYTEPHVHFDCKKAGVPSSTASNVTWRIEWEWANINGTWSRGTNQATMGITNNYTHYMLELGHITNNPPLNISAVFRCRLTRPASASQEYDPAANSHEVILDAFDLHVPIGNQNAIGSSKDNAP